MGIRFLCPNGHKLNVKSFLAGKRALCPQCGAKVLVPDSPAPVPEASASAGEVVAAQRAAGEQPAVPPQASSTPPSVLIALAEDESVTPDGAASEAFVVPTLPIGPPPTPDAIKIAPDPMPAPAEPIAMLPDVAYNLHRARNRRNQWRIAIALVVLVVVLAIVLIWVLRRNANLAPASTSSATKGIGAEPLLTPALVSHDLHHHAKSKV
jgi:hypothetical protein